MVRCRVARMAHSGDSPAFVAAMDPIEAHLTDLADMTKKAWQNCGDSTSPLGEIAAYASAILQFYQETYRTKKPAKLADESVAPHWSDEWRRRE